MLRPPETVRVGGAGAAACGACSIPRHRPRAATRAAPTTPVCSPADSPAVSIVHGAACWACPAHRAIG